MKNEGEKSYGMYGGNAWSNCLQGLEGQEYSEAKSAACYKLSDIYPVAGRQGVCTEKESCKRRGSSPPFSKFRWCFFVCLKKAAIEITNIVKAAGVRDFCYGGVRIYRKEINNLFQTIF